MSSTYYKHIANIGISLDTCISSAGSIQSLLAPFAFVSMVNICPLHYINFDWLLLGDWQVCLCQLSALIDLWME